MAIEIFSTCCLTIVMRYVLNSLTGIEADSHIWAFVNAKIGISPRFMLSVFKVEMIKDFLAFTPNYRH